MMDIEPFEVRDIEGQWEADNGRCAISHAGRFRPVRNATIAFTPPARSLSDLRVALASSGGVYPRGAHAYDLECHHGDISIRWIAADTPARNLRFAHDHYDHTDCDADPNCMFPLDRLRQLAAEGVIGTIAPLHLGFMGWNPDPAELLERTVPEIIARFRRDAVDAVVFSPG